MKLTIDYYLNSATCLAIVLICLFVVGCVGGKIYKDDNYRIYVQDFVEINPVTFKAKVEYTYYKTKEREQRKELETMKLDCQNWRLTIYDRISFDKNGKIVGMSQFNVNNEFPVEGNTIGSLLFGHFCVDR